MYSSTVSSRSTWQHACCEGERDQCLRSFQSVQKSRRVCMHLCTCVGYIWCFQRWSSTYLDCNLYLFKLPLPSYKLKAVWLFFSGSNNFCPEDCLVETPVMVVLENSRRSVSEILRGACLPEFKVNSVAFHPHSDSQFEFEHVILTMSTFLNALSYCHMIGWFNSCVRKQLSRCT